MTGTWGVVSWVSGQVPVGVPVRRRRAGRRIRCAGAGSPAEQQAQGVLGGRPRLGGVGEEALTGTGSQQERLEWQFSVADDRVMDELHAGGVDPDVWAVHRTRNWSLRASWPAA
jgi:hypothetical protein